MKIEDIKWENIDKLEDHHITYLLYREGKDINTISYIRNMTKPKVEKQIIKCKIAFNSKAETSDKLLQIISMNKNDRLEYLNKIDQQHKNEISEEIIKRYMKFKNSEDRTILIWLIGELKDYRLIPYLRMELKSNRVNHRRLACSALGKIKALEGKQWLEDALMDENPQVRQYAVKALSYVGNQSTIKKLKNLMNSTEEKDYVKRKALEAIEILEKRLSL